MTTVGIAGQSSGRKYYALGLGARKRIPSNPMSASHRLLKRQQFNRNKMGPMGLRP